MKVGGAEVPVVASEVDVRAGVWGRTKVSLFATLKQPQNNNILKAARSKTLLTLNVYI